MDLNELKDLYYEKWEIVVEVGWEEMFLVIYLRIYIF